MKVGKHICIQQCRQEQFRNIWEYIFMNITNYICIQCLVLCCNVCFDIMLKVIFGYVNIVVNVYEK